MHESQSCVMDTSDILEYYYLTSPPADPTDEAGPEASLSPREWVIQDGVHGALDDYVSSHFTQSPQATPCTSKSRPTLHMETSTSSDHRRCAIVPRPASKSLPTSPDSPSPEDAFSYVPSEFGWRSIYFMHSEPQTNHPSETLVAERLDRPQPLRSSAPLLRRKGHIRRASEPLTTRDAQDPPMLTSVHQLLQKITTNGPQLATSSPEMSPSSPSVSPQTPPDGSPIPETKQRILFQILGASGLPQGGVLKRGPKAYADVTVGSQSFRTSTSEKRSTNPVWNSNFLFESVVDTDSLVIRIWNEAGPNAQRAWLGSFMCTIRRILLMQAIKDVLTFTLDRWPDEGHVLESTPCGSVHVCIRDLTSPPHTLVPAPFMRVSGVPRFGTESSQYHRYPSSPFILQPGDLNDNSRVYARPSTPLIVLPDMEQSPAPSPLPSLKQTHNSDARPRWVGDIVGRTLSLSRNNYPWVPTGDIDIKTGPVCAGGHCDIYRGELRREGVVTEVALKQLRVFTNASDNMKKMFRREVQFWSRLRHPNVLPFWGCYELDEYRLFMVSPWACNGNSLQYVQKNPEVDRRRILRQTAEALVYLHSGTDGDALVHGDLKADNVLISETGDALLADFGLTRYVEKMASISRTPSGISPHGHIRFSSPELLCPTSLEDPRPTPESDVFAFACYLIQLYSEEMPFAEIKRDVQVLTEILRGNRPSRPQGAATARGLNDDLWTLANECWQFMPTFRPSMTQVADRLR